MVYLQGRMGNHCREEGLVGWDLQKQALAGRGRKSELKMGIRKVVEGLG